MSQRSKFGVREMGLLGTEYRDALEKPSSYDIQIDLDVPRTINGHIMFRTRYGAGYVSLSLFLLKKCLYERDVFIANDHYFTFSTASHCDVISVAMSRVWAL